MRTDLKTLDVYVNGRSKRFLQMAMVGLAALSLSLGACGRKEPYYSGPYPQDHIRAAEEQRNQVPLEHQLWGVPTQPQGGALTSPFLVGE